jgi:hypothetical protein
MSQKAERITNTTCKFMDDFYESFNLIEDIFLKEIYGYTEQRQLYALIDKITEGSEISNFNRIEVFSMIKTSRR